MMRPLTQNALDESNTADSVLTEPICRCRRC